jgi:LysR family transcriptional regulator, glycine cleavage system transcriptional activator
MSEPQSPPPYDLPPLAWLRAFEAAARHSSFTAAAQELNLTQAAVSHQVRSLEKHLGVMLFERLARTLRLTEMGTAYLPPLRRAFDELTAATSGLFGPIGKHTLVVRAPVSFASLWLAPRLHGFHQAYPQVGLRIVSAVWSHPTDNTVTADVDIRLGDGVWPGYRADLLAQWPAIAVVRPDKRPQGSSAERLAALSAHPLVRVTGYEDLWQRLYRQHDVAVPATGRGVDVDTTLAALELAASGFGPTIVLAGLAEGYIAAGRLVSAFDEALPVDMGHYVLTPDGARRQRPEAVLFRAWLKAELSKEPARSDAA